MTKRITEKVFANACDAYKGFCTTCQKFTRRECEPDARGYDCPKCKGRTVYGAEEALMMGILTF
jgi:hypothetical protein